MNNFSVQGIAIWPRNKHMCGLNMLKFCYFIILQIQQHTSHNILPYKILKGEWSCSTGEQASAYAAKIP